MICALVFFVGVLVCCCGMVVAIGYLGSALTESKRELGPISMEFRKEKIRVGWYGLIAIASGLGIMCIALYFI